MIDTIHIKKVWKQNKANNVDTRNLRDATWRNG